MPIDARFAGHDKDYSGGSVLNFESFIRPDIAAMKPYIPILPFEVLSQRLNRAPEAIVKLDANENPYGPSPKVREALANAAFLNIYPDPDNTFLREALAKFTGLPKERLFPGAGADELIDLVLRATITPGDVVINCPPSFGMYPFSADVNAAQLIEVPRRADFRLDVPAIEDAVRSNLRAKVLFVCSPNNPDGCVISDDDLRRLLALPVLVVLDEAYVEFTSPPAPLSQNQTNDFGRGGVVTQRDEALGKVGHISWTLDYPNLAVFRTFSKLAGLAGLRVGYGAFPEWLLPQLWKIKQPYNVNVAATLAAMASLEDIATLQDNLGKLIAERERMSEALGNLDFLQPYPSQSNFILCRVLDRDARQLKLALEQQGILVRYFDKPDLRDCIRISVGKPEHTKALIAALKRVTSNA
jgi:histidinol-phosphate aminotransferase